MNNQANIFDFGRFRLDSRESRLLQDGQPIPLEPQVLKTLQVLVENSPHLCERAWLIEQVWGDTIVEDGNLARNISLLRKALGDRENGNRFIETVPKRGYRFVATVNLLPDYGLERLLNADYFNRAVTGTTGVSNEKKPLDHENTTRSDFSQPSYKSRTRRLSYFLITIALVTVIVAGLGFVHRWRSLAVNPNRTTPLRMTQSQTLTTGNAIQVGISPDGKQVAYVRDDGEGQSLWLRQIATDNEIRLLPPRDVMYSKVAYSRDGYSVFYIVDNALNEIPVLGGVPRTIFENVSGVFSLSHNGKQIAFYRQTENPGDQYLVVAHTDGSEERVVATNPPPNYCWGGMDPVWSPNDQQVGCLLLSTGQNEGRFVAVHTDGSGVGYSTPREWKLAFGGEWTKDGLIVSAQRNLEDQWQLWNINTASGEVSRLTNDWPNYKGVSLSADGHSLATIQMIKLMNVWVVPLKASGEEKQITSGASVYFDVSVTADDKLLYSTFSGGVADVWQMDLDGSNRRQLTRNAGSNYSPVASPDGHYLLFHSNRGGTYYLYRTRSDGNEPQRLTSEIAEEATADVSPDSKTVVFAFGALKRVPIEGGAAIVLNNKLNHTPVISPDGKLVATWYMEDTANNQRIALFSLDKAGDPLRVFQVPTKDRFGDRIRWTTDGQGLLYVHTSNGISNIWLQPLDGSQPRQITKFKNERIFSFAVSRDGRNLVCVRGTEANDVVVLTER